MGICAGVACTNPIDSLYTADSAAKINLWQRSPEAPHGVACDPVATVAAAHDGEVFSLISHGEMLLTAGADRCVRIWGGATLSPDGALATNVHTASIFALALLRRDAGNASGSGGEGKAILASADAAGEVVLWDLEWKEVASVTFVKKVEGVESYCLFS